MTVFAAQVLFTKHIQKKRKTWQDGWLHVSVNAQDCSNRVGKLYDESGTLFSSARIPSSQQLDADTEGAVCSVHIEELSIYLLIRVSGATGITAFEGLIVNVDQICSPTRVPNARISGQISQHSESIKSPKPCSNLEYKSASGMQKQPAFTKPRPATLVPKITRNPSVLQQPLARANHSTNSTSHRPLSHPALDALQHVQQASSRSAVKQARTGMPAMLLTVKQYASMSGVV